MARFTTRLSGNSADSFCVYAHRRHTVYCVSCADWRSPRVHPLHTAGRHLGLRHSPVHSAGFITGVRLDGQAASGSRERHELRGHIVYLHLLAQGGVRAFSGIS